MWWGMVEYDVCGLLHGGLAKHACIAYKACVCEGEVRLGQDRLQYIRHPGSGISQTAARASSAQLCTNMHVFM
jgi:hypothetical protein